MEFAKAKIFTALNADEVKVGSNGYFADNLRSLRGAAEEECSRAYGEIEEIMDNSYGCRFRMKDGNTYALTDEMVQDLKIDKQPGRPKTKTEKKRPGKRKAAAIKKKGPRYCWRVSVWNDELMKYVVVKCGMTKKQADEFAAGKNAVKRPCWR